MRAAEVLIIGYGSFFVLVLAGSYTPLKRIEGMPPALPYDPVRCNGCAAVLNPFW